MDVQLKKGFLEACVLASLYKNDGYGYIIIKEISEVIAISESTLYPILRRLEQSKCLETYSVECDGRLRKYYRITDAGREKLNEFTKQWETLAGIYEYITKKCN